MSKKAKRRPNRRPASKYIEVIDNLLQAVVASEVTRVVVAELVGVEYITLDKYLRKERNVNDAETAKRMVVTTDLLLNMVKKGKLPIPGEVNARLRSSVILDTIDEFIRGKKDPHA